MGIANDIASLDATAQAELVRNGSVSSSELVEAAIEGAHRVNPQINAIIHPRYEAAAAEAGTPGSGPFAGVPMVVKDLGCMMKGEPYHLGSRSLKSVGNRGSVDSALYRRFREAGFVAIGRTNAPEFGSTITTEPLAYGPSRNPWNLDYSADRRAVLLLQSPPASSRSATPTMVAVRSECPHPNVASSG